ncbi:hypothetical protein UlMin_000936 [Ulmus minor]
MMQPELVQPTWPIYDVLDSTWDQIMEHCNFSTHVSEPEFSSLFSESSSIPFSSIFSGESSQFTICDDYLRVKSLAEDFPMGLEGFEHGLSDEFEGLYGCLEESVGSFHSQQFSVVGNDVWSPSSSMDITSIQLPVLNFPGEDIEIENELSVRHLLRAYGEAIEKEQRELGEVLLRCIGEKVSPLGTTWERLAFELAQRVLENQGAHLKQESFKNFETALKVFYQKFPHGKFAHYSANSAILEAITDDAETLHIVDFDMGEGLQWPQMIEAAARKQKKLKLTSIRWEEREADDLAPLQWRFEEARRQLLDHARSFGLKLKVEEKGIEDLISEIKNTRKRGGGKEFLAFNCMVGLPHMRRVRSRRHVMQFLSVAKDLLANFNNSIPSNIKGVIVLGDGDACEKKLKDCSSFSPFFDQNLVHYQALLESIEASFPPHLADARTTMECLFVAPYLSSAGWFQRWEDVKEGWCMGEGIVGLEGWRLSKESLREAIEMVREQSSYGVRIEGMYGNEMALEWKGVPLVRVSTWITQS